MEALQLQLTQRKFYKFHTTKIFTVNPLPLIIFLVLTTNLVCVESSKKYGDSCSRNPLEDCDVDNLKNTFLKCSHHRDGTCICQSDEMFYNETTESCFVFAERSCKVNPNCIINSKCNSDEGICKCDLNFKSHLSGRCLPWHNVSCDESLQCHTGGHLICSEKEENTISQLRYCQCKNDTHSWSDKHDTCVGLHGTLCLDESGDKCVDNALCSEEEYCQCSERHSVTPDKNCLLKYGEECNNNSGAGKEEFCNHHEYLRCRNVSPTESRCACHFPNRMIYDTKANKCFMKLGEPCGKLEPSWWNTSEENQYFECLEFAECLPVSRRSDERNSVCKCKFGHEGNNTEVCKEVLTNYASELCADTNVISSIIVIVTIYANYVLKIITE